MDDITTLEGRIRKAAVDEQITKLQLQLRDLARTLCETNYTELKFSSGKTRIILSVSEHEKQIVDAFRDANEALIGDNAVKSFLSSFEDMSAEVEQLRDEL